MKDVFLLHVKVFFFLLSESIRSDCIYLKGIGERLTLFFFIQVNFPQRLSQLQTHLLLKK